MAIIKDGIPVPGTLTPTDSADTYPVIDPIYGIDGLRSVVDILARNNIPASRRRQGMLVVVQEDIGSGPNQTYQLKPPPWNGSDADWGLFITAGSGGALPPGGTTGQSLVKNSGVDGDVRWATVDGAILPGGTTGQTLIKNSNADGDASWGFLAVDGGTF